MKDKTKLKKFLVIGGLAILLFGCMWFVLSDSGYAPDKTEHGAIIPELPDGYTEFISESKTDMYQRKFRHDNEIYYDNLGRNTDTADTSHISLTTKEVSRTSESEKRISDRRLSVDDIFPEEQPVSATEKKYSRPSYSAPGSTYAMTPEERLDFDRQRVEVMKEAMGVAEAGAEDQAIDISEKEPSPRLNVVSAENYSGIVSSLDDDFIGNEDVSVAGTARPVRCMFVRSEKVRNGQRVSVRILEEYKSGNVTIPANTHLSAVCALSDRLSLKVSGIEMNGAIYPLSLTAYDSDGYEGIYCPETGGSKNSRMVAGDAITATSSALGGLVGRLAGSAVRTGANILKNTGGAAVVSIVSGYEFYLMEDVKK